MKYKELEFEYIRDFSKIIVVNTKVFEGEKDEDIKGKDDNRC